MIPTMCRHGWRPMVGANGRPGAKRKAPSPAWPDVEAGYKKEARLLFR